MASRSKELLTRRRSFHDTSARTASGERLCMARFAGKVVMVVNVASR